MVEISVQRGKLENHYSATAGDFQMDLVLGEQRRPRSIDFLLFSLATCTIGTVSHYMKRKGLSTESLAIRLSSDLDQEENRYGSISAVLDLGEGISDKQRAIIKNVANTCRIHKTIGDKIVVHLEINDSEGDINHDN